jgi:hypothetical protein
MTQSQRSYHAFVRAVKDRFEVTHQQAIAAYRAYKVEHRQQPRMVDVARHPRLTARAVETGKRDLVRRERSRNRKRDDAQRVKRKRERKVDEKRLARLINRYEQRKKIGKDGKIYVKVGQRYADEYPGEDYDYEGPDTYVLAIDYTG